MNGRSLRDRLRRRLPWLFAFYKRRLRPHVARRDPHYAIRAWVTEGLELRRRLGLADARFDEGGAWFVDDDGLQWRFEPEIWDPTLGAAIGSKHESAELDAVCAPLGSTSVVVDAGANIGAFALRVARASGARVIAIEPVGSTFALLEANVRRNDARGVVETHRTALSDVPGEVVMTTGAQSANYVMADQVDARAGEERVPVTTLDALLGEEPRIDLVKVDVEGLELRVIQGARQTLARHAPVVLLEIDARWTDRFGYRPHDLFALMADAGYGYEALTPDGPRQATSVDADLQRAHNFLFSPSDGGSDGPSGR